MAQADIQRLERMKASGNAAASLILELMDKCRLVASGEALDGITLAFGIRSERDHDEMLASVTEDMLTDLLPTILKMTYSSMPGTFFDGLSFHLSVTQRLDVAIFAHHRWHKAWPRTVTLSTQWKTALTSATSYTYRDGGDEHEVTLLYAPQPLEKMICEE